MKIVRLTVWIVLLTLLAACSGAPPATEAATNTVPAAEPTATDTPEPTPDLAATEQAQATSDAAVLIEAILPDLEMAGFTTETGSLGYAQAEPIEITANQPYDFPYEFIADPNPVFANFVMGYDVKWESETGLAGCGIRFRGDDDIERGQYADFYALRLSGLPVWEVDLIKFNQFQASLSGDFRTNSAINQAQGSTNHYVIAANGSTITLYANGNRLGVATANEALRRGQIAYETWQESGITTCTFSNGWVWQLPD